MPAPFIVIFSICVALPPSVSPSAAMAVTGNNPTTRHSDNKVANNRFFMFISSSCFSFICYLALRCYVSSVPVVPVCRAAVQMLIVPAPLRCRDVVESMAAIKDCDNYINVV
ncbi:MAG: hypothetical protein Q4C76_00195 [Bacillota bacterium]|nr:hypothetical protein [Bacillota bacterium]